MQLKNELFINFPKKPVTLIFPLLFSTWLLDEQLFISIVI